MSYQKFRAAWLHFVALLDERWDESFSCKKCGEEPKQIIMDGTAISVMKHRLGAARTEADGVPSAVEYKYGILFDHKYRTNYKI